MQLYSSVFHYHAYLFQFQPEVAPTRVFSGRRAYWAFTLRQSITAKYPNIGTFTGWCWRRPGQSSGKTTTHLRPPGAGRRFAWDAKQAYWIRMDRSWRGPPPVPAREKAVQSKALVLCRASPQHDGARRLVNSSRGWLHGARERHKLAGVLPCK